MYFLRGFVGFLQTNASQIDDFKDLILEIDDFRNLRK